MQNKGRFFISCLWSTILAKISNVSISSCVRIRTKSRSRPTFSRLNLALIFSKNILAYSSIELQFPPTLFVDNVGIMRDETKEVPQIARFLQFGISIAADKQANENAFYFVFFLGLHVLSLLSHHPNITFLVSWLCLNAYFSFFD